MQSKRLAHDLELMDIIPKGHDDVNFNKEAKSKYKSKGTNKGQYRNSLQQKAEAFLQEGIKCPFALQPN